MYSFETDQYPVDKNRFSSSIVIYPVFYEIKSEQSQCRYKQTDTHRQTSCYIYIRIPIFRFEEITDDNEIADITEVKEDSEESNDKEGNLCRNTSDVSQNNDYMYSQIFF